MSAFPANHEDTTARRPAALVMAGSGGIGRAAAVELGRAGHDVAILARGQDRLDDAVAELHGQGVRAAGLAGDVRNPSDLRDAVKLARDTLGPIGVLVANAGGPPTGSFDELDAATWESAFELTLMSVVHAVGEVLPSMRDQGWGRIIVVGSSSVRRPLPRLTLSNTFRPALNGLVKDLSVSEAAAGITVNLVAPGRIDTDRVRQLDEQRAETAGTSTGDVRAASEASIPAGRYGRPQEIGSVIAFLASAQSAYVTGQTILVDGGLVATLP